MNNLASPSIDATNQPAAAGGITGWLSSNAWWIGVAIAIVGSMLLVFWLFHNELRTKRLQRDALEKMRKNLLASCKNTRGPARSIWLTGGPSDPGMRLGRYKGHYRSVECVWLAYKPSLFSKTKLVCANPVDVASLRTPEVHLRGIGIHHARDLSFLTPDTHNTVALADWNKVAPKPIETPRDFAEAIKAYYAGCVDNALAVYDAMNAAEDRSFLRQEVTRSQDERTETISIPAQPTPKNDAPPTE